jgi:Bacterial extracellular solute-binding protein
MISAEIGRASGSWIASLFPILMETRIVGGKIYGLPMEVESMAMYYSVKALQKAGLSEANIPKTWRGWRREYRVFPLSIPPDGVPKTVLGGEPRIPSEVYKAISDADPGLPVERR